MNKKMYLIEYAVILCILTFFNRNNSIGNLIVSFIIVILQYFFDYLRIKYMKKNSFKKSQ